MYLKKLCCQYITFAKEEIRKIVDCKYTLRKILFTEIQWSKITIFYFYVVTSTVIFIDFLITCNTFYTLPNRKRYKHYSVWSSWFKKVSFFLYINKRLIFNTCSGKKKSTKMLCLKFMQLYCYVFIILRYDHHLYYLFC